MSGFGFFLTFHYLVLLIMHFSISKYMLPSILFWLNLSPMTLKFFMEVTKSSSQPGVIFLIPGLNGSHFLNDFIIFTNT